MDKEKNEWINSVDKELVGKFSYIIEESLYFFEEEVVISETNEKMTLKELIYTLDRNKINYEYIKTLLSYLKGVEKKNMIKEKLLGDIFMIITGKIENLMTLVSVKDEEVKELSKSLEEKDKLLERERSINLEVVKQLTLLNQRLNPPKEEKLPEVVEAVKKKKEINF